MPERVIQPMTDLAKGGVIIGGMSTPTIINNPAMIDYKWLTVHAFLNITYDVWILLVSLLLALHTLGLFKGIRWLYRNVPTMYRKLARMVTS